jgi:hypothetical protein
MTPEEHNKYVGIANLAYGAIHTLLMFGMGLFFLGMMGVIARDSAKGGAPPMAFFGLMMAFVVGLNLIMSIPSFVAGYAFLKRKRWAKVAGIIAAAVSGMSVPLGTAVCIYTFWFLFSEPGKSLYGRSSQALPPPPPSNWADLDRQKGREQQYVPPASPPDWRS